MWIGVVIVAAATALQYAAVVLALRLLRVTGRSAAWVTIAGVAVLMAARRTLVLVQVLVRPDAYALDLAGESDALGASVLLMFALARLGPYLTTLHRTQAALRQRSADLDQRVRELRGLYTLASLVEQKGPAADEILAAVGGVVVASLNHPVRAATRLTSGSRAWEHGDFQATRVRVACDIIVAGAKDGQLEAGYAPTNDGARVGFLEEEKDFLAAVAERLGRTLERLRVADERAAMEEQLAQAQKMEAVGQLSAGLAHDFDNLLVLMRGHVARLDELLPPNDAAREQIGLLHKVVTQGADLTRALLTFSRPAPAATELVRLDEVVADAVRLLRHTLPATIDLRVCLPPKPLWIKGAATQLQQVVFTLAMNARDALPDGGVLRIAVRRVAASRTAVSRGQGCARLIVIDTGVGMTPAVRARIFEPFFTTKPRGQGTGLGLSIVHGIVAAHGGQISVQSSPRAGTSFFIDFPLAARIGPSSAQTERCYQGKGRLVLLADPEPYIRGMLALSLEALGYRVVQAGDDEAVLHLAEQLGREIALYLVGTGLSRDGEPACLAELRARGTYTPALVLADTEVSWRPLDTHTRLLRKPFDVPTLGRALATALGGVTAGEAAHA